MHGAPTYMLSDVKSHKYDVTFHYDHKIILEDLVRYILRSGDVFLLNFRILKYF